MSPTVGWNGDVRGRVIIIAGPEGDGRRRERGFLPAGASRRLRVRAGAGPAVVRDAAGERDIPRGR